jgi:hypothetical protein
MDLDLFSETGARPIQSLYYYSSVILAVGIHSIIENLWFLHQCTGSTFSTMHLGSIVVAVREEYHRGEDAMMQLEWELDLCVSD